jgi:Ni,Fe-hydrogenase III small subunit
MTSLPPVTTAKKVINCYHANIGACNGCDLEVLSLLSTPFLKKQHLEINLVRSIKNADVLLVTGSLSRPLAKRIKELKESISANKTIIAVGACAINGGLWRESYTIIGGIDKILQVNCFVTGCPPTPDAILYSLESALVSKKKQFSPLFYKER